jgi:hypothetical protein
MATMPNTNINIPYSAFIDESTGRPTQAWLLWLMSPNFITVNLGSALAVTSGGTGLTTIPTNGQLLIGNGSGYTLNTLGTGVGISVVNAAGTITIANTGVLSNIAGSGISVSSATGDVTIANTGVLSFSGGTTGLTPATATTGAVTLAGTLGIANGGTNGSATPTAGAVAYGTGTAYAFTAAGTAGQVLTSNGAGVPTWTTNAGGDVTGPASSTDNAIARFDGVTGKLIQNSVTLIDDTGNASGILSQQFSNGAAVTLAAGKMWYDGSTGAWNLGMGNGNITQQVGEEIFVYGKASAAITDSPLQIIYHTGVVGASGVIQFAPTVAGITDVNAIIGVATENLAHNDFGRATVFGVVRGITTNGTAFGETWADDDVIWYNPVTGNPTKVEPVAPYIKVQVGLVIKAGSGGSGSFQVGISRGSTLGGTDSNVQIGTPSNGQILTYDGAATYWKNTTLTAGTGVSISPSASGVLTVSATGSGGTVTSVSFTGGIITVANPTTTPALTVAGTSGGIPYFSSGTTWASSAALTQYGVVYGGGAGATPVTTAAGTTGQVLTATTGGAPSWAAPATNGTVTSVSVVSANGFAGTVATATTTPAITLTTSITGVLKGNGTAISAAVVNTDYFAPSAPVTKTANFTVADSEVWLINNKSGSTCTVTLPTASSWTGRVLRFQNYQVQTVVSASSNVVPLTGGAAATSILLASSGDAATLVSDGTNWLVTQYIPNNILLLE